MPHHQKQKGVSLHILSLHNKLRSQNVVQSDINAKGDLKTTISNLSKEIRRYKRTVLPRLSSIKGFTTAQTH